MKSPHAEQWRKSLAAEYKKCVRTRRNVDNITAVLAKAGVSTDELRQLYINATIDMVDVPVDTLRQVVSSLPRDNCNIPVVL